MRSKLAIVALVLALAASAKALDLRLLWTYKAGWVIEGLAFSDNGNLGAASWDHCAYVFDQSGNLLNKVCGSIWMSDASYCCGRFGFVNGDGYAYITDESGNLIKKVHVGDYYDAVITMLENGFIAGRWRLAYFDLNGTKRWDVDVGLVGNGPSVYNGYVYVANWLWDKLLILKLSDGSEVKEISYGEPAYDTAVCGNYLAVTTGTHLHLYSLEDPANPRELWSVGGIADGWQVAFSPDCEYVAVADRDGYKLYIYDLNGNKVLEKGYGSTDDDQVTAVAWWRDRIAVGLANGTIYVYKVEGYAPSAPNGTQPPQTTTAPITTTSSQTSTTTVSVPTNTSITVTTMPANVSAVTSVTHSTTVTTSSQSSSTTSTTETATSTATKVPGPFLLALIPMAFGLRRARRK